MGMDVNMLACVRALAENRIQDAKKYAVCCCANDNTKKNESQVRRCKNLLLNGCKHDRAASKSQRAHAYGRCVRLSCRAVLPWENPVGSF